MWATATAQEIAHEPPPPSRPPSPRTAQPGSRACWHSWPRRNAAPVAHRTVEGYARMLWPFLLRVGSPELVTSGHVLGWAYGVGTLGREPSSAMIGAPTDLPVELLPVPHSDEPRHSQPVRRPGASQERPIRGSRLNADEVRRLLAVVPETMAAIDAVVDQPTEGPALLIAS